MIRLFVSKTSKKTEDYLSKVTKINFQQTLHRYGQEGVLALSRATPVDTGRTANSWTYELKPHRGGYYIIWKNTNVVNGVPIAIILNYGHGTGTGGWVQGRKYINPAIQPIFDKFTNEVWRQVKDV